MTTGVYAITHVPTGRAYVGSSIDIEDRWRDHRWELRTNRHLADYMQNTYNKYGVETFRYDIIEECAAEVRIEREQHYLDTMEPVFNACKVAGVTTGYKHTPESLAKMRGRVVSSETRAGMTKRMTGNVVSLETRAKMSASRKGRKCSPETRAKLSAAKKGHAVSPEARAKIGAASRGRLASPETRTRMSAAHRGKAKSAEHLAAISATKARNRAIRSRKAGQASLFDI